MATFSTGEQKEALLLNPVTLTSKALVDKL